MYYDMTLELNSAPPLNFPYESFCKIFPILYYGFKYRKTKRIK